MGEIAGNMKQHPPKAAARSAAPLLCAADSDAIIILEPCTVPTVRNVSGPYRLFFYSFDCNEPKHVHVRRERMVCKFWLAPVALSFNEGFSPAELNRMYCAPKFGHIAN